MIMLLDTDQRHRVWTAAQLAQRFGAIPLWRIVHDPLPGLATERDVVRLQEDEGRLCELIDGVLVEKTVGWYESWMAVRLGSLLREFVDARGSFKTGTGSGLDVRIPGRTRVRQVPVPVFETGSRLLGLALGTDGTIRLMPHLVRIPDVSFISFERLRGRNPQELLDDPLLDSAPDLAAEILSRSNTRKEMQQKLQEYFDCGVRLVWFVEPRKQHVRVYTSPERFTTIAKDGVFDGGEVLPGFQLPLCDLFINPLTQNA